MSGTRVELQQDCERCGLEQGAVARYDADVPACRFGVPAEVRCRLCGARSEGVVQGERATLVEVDRGVLPRDRAALDRALAAWADREGYASVDELLQAGFVEPDREQILQALAAGQPILTVADPFGIVGVSDREDREPPPPPRPSVLTRVRPRDPRAIVGPLVAMMLADGRVDPRERAVADRFLAEQGLEPIAEPECTVRSPLLAAREVPVDLRPAMLEVLCEMVWADGVADPSELRLLDAVSRSWAVPSVLVDAWLDDIRRRRTTWWRRLSAALRGLSVLLSTRPTVPEVR